MRQWFKANRFFLLLLLCFGLFRTAIADWNPIPSGSMRPSILEGDVVLVNRLAYDLKVPLTEVSLVKLGEPQRGEVVTFYSPRDHRRLIKRVVALPGDRVEIRNDVLFINGDAAIYTDVSVTTELLEDDFKVEANRAVERISGDRRSVQFLPELAVSRSFGPVSVPAGQYFMLGDNRNNSADSRYIGFVPRDLLIGRAERILLSVDIKGNWLPRFGRTAARLQ